MDAERNLLYLYLGCIVSGVTAASSLGIAWGYWSRTLNTCVDVNCGCILYSTTTFNSFVGGTVSLCRFSTLVQIPVLLWAICMLSFHTYRVCIPKTNKPTPARRTVSFSEDGTRYVFINMSCISAIVQEVVNKMTGVVIQPLIIGCTVTMDFFIHSGYLRPNTRNARSPPMYTPLAIVAGLIAVLLVAEVWVITGGYYSTCREYRKTVAKQISANGNLAELVFDRMSCGTVLDFLDYLQSDPPMLEQQYRRTYIINTAYFLQFSVVFSWISCLTWTMTALYNTYLCFHK